MKNTTTYQIPSLNLNNLSLFNLIKQLNHYFALPQNSLKSIPIIISEQTGEIIETIQIKSNIYTIPQLLDLQPYLNILIK
jgi:hypothetical protein